MTRDEELRTTSHLIHSQCTELQVTFSELKWRAAEVKRQIHSATEQLDQARYRTKVFDDLTSAFLFL
jgi:hypothetical protein